MKLNVLLLCNKPSTGLGANTVVNHIEAFTRYSEHEMFICSNLGDLSNQLDLARFDVIIIHYSLSLLGHRYLSVQAKKRLRAYNGLKVIFIQDEYRRINDMVNELAYLKIDVLFTCFPEAEFENIYPLNKLPWLSKYQNLTGYISEEILACQPVPPTEKRLIDVGYRGRRLPYWYGALGYEKSNIVEKWYQHVPPNLLTVNLSYRETDRIYGKAWIDFLMACKTTLGVESGVSVMDFTGNLERQVTAHELKFPKDPFESVQKKYFINQEGRYRLNQISPRCFEAIALKTVLVLYEGEYSGILTPGKHYIVLKKDFSNISDVVAAIQNNELLQTIADRAYQDIALNPQYHYRTFIQTVDEILVKEFVARKKIKILLPYDKIAFHQTIGTTPWRNKILMRLLSFYQGLPFEVRLKIKGFLGVKS